MDLRKIKKLIDLLDESNLAEIEIKEGEESVRLSRMPKGMSVHAPTTQVHYSAPPHAEPARPAPVQAPSPDLTHIGKGGRELPEASRPLPPTSPTSARVAASCPKAMSCARRWSARSMRRRTPSPRRS